MVSALVTRSNCPGSSLGLGLSPSPRCINWWGGGRGYGPASHQGGVEMSLHGTETGLSSASMSHLACMHTSEVSKDETPSEVSSVYHKELVTNTIIDEKNLRDKLRLMSALFPGMIISPFSSLIGCSRSGLGNSTTSGCYKKRQIRRITTQVNHG